MTTSGNRSG